MVHVGARVASSASTCGSASAGQPARHVEPNAASDECVQATSRAIANASASLGLDPGQPSSMKPTPSASSIVAMRILSAAERLSPSRCVPSRRVTS
jgi:hypothetical protein